jgi:uncharacterized membrane protein YphA (DoxX/SURF4 family)
VVAGETSPAEALARVPRWSMLLLRLYLGAAFLSAAMNKIGENWKPWPGWMAEGMQSALSHHVPMPIYREFLSTVVVAHAAFFARAVACGEVAVGCCLLLGLATRAAALGGAFLTLNYLFDNGALRLLPSSHPPFIFGSNDPVFVLACVAISAGAVGRALGLDYLLHRRFPRLLIC